jgi:ERCC4-related helicase
MIDVAMKGLVEAMPSETHLKALEPSPEAQVVKENVNAGVKTLAERCAGENTIIELPKTLEALNRMHLAAEVCRVCLGSRSHGKAAVDCKAVVVAPTVPLVRQHVEVVRQVTSLRAKEVIGNAEVDAWRR